MAQTAFAATVWSPLHPQRNATVCAQRRHQHRVIACAKKAAERRPIDATTSSTEKSTPLLTMDDVVAHAELRGFRVEKYAAGPVCRLDIFQDEELYAFVTGVVMPTGWLHIESYKAKAKEDGGLLSVTPGMIVFIYALAFGADRGCKEVYGLAIRDSSAQHKKLKRYLKRYGGKEVKVVDDSIPSIPDRLLYGGLGTIIKGDLMKMLTRSSTMIARERVRIESKGGAVE